MVSRPILDSSEQGVVLQRSGNNECSEIDNDDDASYYRETGYLLALSPTHVVMAHNLEYNNTLLGARQLWRRLDVVTKTFMDPGVVRALHYSTQELIPTLTLL